MDKVNTERIEDAEGQPMAPLKSGEANGTSSQAHDAVFGDLNEEGPNYRAVSSVPITASKYQRAFTLKPTLRSVG